MSDFVIPTPPDLDRDPELSVLAVLEICVEAATHAVVAQQPALRSGDPDQTPLRDSHWVALAFVHVGDDLVRTIRAYRAALDRERGRERNQKTDDYPF